MWKEISLFLAIFSGYCLSQSTSFIHGNSIIRQASCPATCLLPKEEGFFRNDDYRSPMPKWYFNAETRSCQAFSYSGRGGNANRFSSEEQCNSNCMACYDEGAVLPSKTVKPRCDCGYHRGGCVITVTPPSGWKCVCRHASHWKCHGVTLPCGPRESCPARCSSEKCCRVGGGNCDGYPTKVKKERYVGGIKEDTLAFLAEGESKVLLGNAFHDLVYFVGEPGSGKSIVARLLSKQNSDLISVKSPPGSGEFVIQIKGHDPVMGSIFPELVRGYDAGMYDLPEFNDTRPFGQDFSAAYFTTQAIALTQTIRVVAVVSYSAVSSGGDPSQFNALVDHMSAFLKAAEGELLVAEAEGLKQSIGLIVTQVDNVDGKTDEELVKDIGYFIQVQGRSEAFVNAITVVDDQGSYIKIGVLRKPTVAGPISTIQVYQDERAKIKALVKALVASPKTGDEFGYLLNSMNLKQLPLANLLLPKYFNAQFNGTLFNATGSWETELSVKLAASTDWGGDAAIMKEKLEISREAEEDLDDRWTNERPFEFLDKFQAWMQQLGTPVGIVAINELRKQGSYMDFLQHLSSRFDLFHVSNPFSYVIEPTIENTVLWFGLFDVVRTKLSDYEYQRDPSLYDVADLNNWGKGGTPGIHISQDNFPQFCQLLGLARPPIVSEDWLGRLNELLRAELDTHISDQVLNGTRTIQGRTFVLSQLKAGNETELRVFALEKIFIDTGLKKAGLNVALIAPAMQVVGGDLKFSLDGADNQTVLPAPEKADTGQRGEDGEAGFPGGTAGYFLAVTADCDSLFNYNPYVSQIGGLGGRGQQGGEGGDGGESEPGAAGGDGGIGGKGGFGGYELLVDVQSNNSHSPTPNNGNQGDNGLGGKGGAGSYQGPDGIPGNSHKDWTDPEPALPSAYYANPLAAFKSYVRQNSEDAMARSRLLEFYALIEQNTRINSVYSVEGLLVDYIMLEAQYVPNYDKVQMEPFYESFVARLEVYANTTLNPTDLAAKKALAYLYTTSLAKYNAIQQGEDKNLITKLNTFIDGVVVPNIQKLATVQKQEYIDNQRDQFRDKVNVDRDNAYQYINGTVGPAIEADMAELGTETEELIEEVKELEKQAEAKKEALLAKQAALKKRALIDGIFGGLKIIGAIIGAAITVFVGPEGAAVGAGIDSVLDVADNFALDQFPVPPVPDLKVPDGVRNTVDNINAVVDGNKDASIDALSDQIAKIQTLCEEQTERLGDLGKKLDKMQTDLKTLKSVPSVKGVQGVNKVKADFKEQINEKKDELDKAGQAGDTTSAKLKKAFDGFIAVAKVGYEVYNKYKEDQNALKAVAESIQEEDEEIKRIQDFEDSIYSSLIPLLNGVEQNIRDMEDGLATKKYVGLDIAQWQVQGTLQELAEHIEVVTKGFAVEDQYLRTIGKLKQAIVLLIQLYERIQALVDKKVLADYIADIESPGSAAISFDGTPYGPYVTALDDVILTNLVLIEFDRVVSAFKQWIFPFADYNSAIFYLPASLQPSNGSVIQPTDVILSATQRIDEVKEALAKYQSTTDERYSKYIEMGKFSFDGTPNPPFYTWTQEEFFQETSALLQGQAVAFLADIRRRTTLKDAIKFSQIDLHLSLKDSTRQADLDQVLLNYEVLLSHSGNSYYSFHDKIYQIFTPQQDMSFSFLKGPDGNPAEYNLVYQSLLDGDIILSPYCLWTIKLVPTSSANGIQSYEDLKEYAQIGLDVQLVGYGKYVLERDEWAPLPDLNMNKYYKQVNQTTLQ